MIRNPRMFSCGGADTVRSINSPFMFSLFRTNRMDSERWESAGEDLAVVIGDVRDRSLLLLFLYVSCKPSRCAAPEDLMSAGFLLIWFHVTYPK